MLTHIPKLVRLKNFEQKFRYILGISVFQALGSFASNIQYAVLPVAVMMISDEWVAGVVISIFTLLQIFVFDPLGGAFADRWSARKSILLSNFLTILEAKDIDHKEDGAFSALRNMIANIGYAVAPVTAGWIYTMYGFETSLWYITIVCGLLALYMTWKTYQFETEKPETTLY